MDFAITHYKPYLNSSLLECWNKSLPYDAITDTVFARRVLLDRNFIQEGLILAVTPDNCVIGFISCFIISYPIGKDGCFPDRGFIQAFGVAPEFRNIGVGKSLMKEAEDFFRSYNRKLIVLSPYTPNYFVPGIDVERYTEGFQWLKSQGFEQYSEGLAADSNIATFEISDALLKKERNLFENEGIYIRCFQQNDIVPFLNFQHEFMPGPWYEDARHNLLEMTYGRFSPTAIWLAFNSKNEIIGFCQHENEHFGPFGVLEEYQGKSIGTLLLAHTLLQMRISGCHSAWVLWTGERALNGVYGRLGFKLTRRFAIMKKSV